MAVDKLYNNISDWYTNMTEGSVQPDARTTGADFLSSETVVLCSGPRKFKDTGTLTSVLTPIGLVQNVQFSQQKQIQQIYEVGSRTPVFIPGRTVVSAAISRILFDGPSLMQAMYLMGATTSTGVELVDPWNGTSTSIHDAPSLPMDPGSKDINGLGGKTARPGQFFINLASSFFNKPMGLGFILYDGEKQAYGGFYLEDVYIQTHNLSIASQQTILVENVSIRTSGLVPLDVSTLS